MEYYQTRSRWAVLEFLEEAKSTRENLRKRGDDFGIRNGTSVLNLELCEAGKKSGELVWRERQSYQGDRRGVKSGDCVQITNPGVPGMAVECTVERRSDPLILKPVNRNDNKRLLQYSKTHAQGQFRMYFKTFLMARA